MPCGPWYFQFSTILSLVVCAAAGAASGAESTHAAAAVSTSNGIAKSMSWRTPFESFGLRERRRIRLSDRRGQKHPCFRGERRQKAAVKRVIHHLATLQTATVSLPLPKR